MKITRENLDRVKNLSGEYREDCEKCNQYQRDLKERYGKQEIEIEREGKKIKITENILWQELLALAQGVDTGARDILKKKYPKFFEMLDNNKTMRDQLNQVEVSVFDAPFSQMSPDRLINIVEGIVDVKQRESQVENIVKKAK